LPQVLHQSIPSLKLFACHS